MKSKTFVMMFLAIGCGLVAAYMTARITAKQATPDTVAVLVAKEKIKAGDVIKDPEKLFVEMRYPVGSTPNAISNLEDLKGKMVSKTVQPGQWVTAEDVSANFGIELPKGYYAMSIKVSPETGGQGFILPKSHVNVLATIRPNGSMSRPKVVTVLQDVLVLAVDTLAARPEDKIAVAGVSTALLAVKPADSQKLTLAQSMGELRLVLRPHDDEERQHLAPLDQLMADTGTGDGAPVNSMRIEAPTYKLAVAKQDLEAGTKIDDPEKLFDVKSFAEVPDQAVAPEKLAELKGKSLKVPLFKDSVLTAKYFDEKLAAVVAVQKAEPRRHLLFIQNGGKLPEAHTYFFDEEAKHWLSELPSDKADKADKAEASKPEPVKPEEIKPEAKPDGSQPGQPGRPQD